MERYSKPRDPQGNFDQMRLLDAHLSLESMLVRETVQNAWDARDPARRAGAPVEWGIHVRRLRGPALDSLRVALADAPAGGLPPAAAEGRSLRQILEGASVDVLLVEDRNTLGLTGPPVSNIGGDPTARRFARFMLDMGRPPGVRAEGGTYGYGKTVLWRASECATVIAYSRYPESGEIRSRLMGAAMGDPYEEAGTPMTGRHWWGRLDPAHNIVPLEGAEADDLARELGLWAADDDRTGTTVLVVGSRFGPDDMLRLREAARWHCWPKWSLVGREAEMLFRFSIDGEELPQLDSSTDPMIGPFASALVDALDGEGERCDVHRPRVLAGRLVTKLAPVKGDPSMVADDDGDVAPITPPLNHVALVRRGPRLHIRFEAFPDPAPAGVMRAGVFLTAEDEGEHSTEAAFAAAEPPTHDDWSWKGLTGTQKTIVKMGLQRLREAMRGPTPDAQPAGKGDGLARLANRLGAMLDTGAGPAAPAPRPGGGGGGKGQRIGVLEREVFREVYEGTPYVVLEFDVQGRSGQPVRLRPSVRIVDGDRRSSEAEAASLAGAWWVNDRHDIEEVGSELALGPADADAGWAMWIPMRTPRRLRLGVQVDVIDG